MEEGGLGDEPFVNCFGCHLSIACIAHVCLQNVLIIVSHIYRRIWKSTHKVDTISKSPRDLQEILRQRSEAFLSLSR